MQPPLPIPARFEAPATRLSEARLKEFAAPPPTDAEIGEPVEIRYLHRLLEDPIELKWLAEQGVAALLFPSPGDPGTIQLAGLGGTVSSRFDAAAKLPVIKVAPDSYGRIIRILEKEIDVTLELEMRTRFNDEPEVSNILAEIPGSDPNLKKEVVLIGAHLDSWTFATGATDNAAGCAVMMEAMRILRALALQPRRTIRMALWSGEEQGGLGSKAYVQQHLWDPGQDSTKAAKPGYETFCVYVNLDGGSGKIRGLFNVEVAATRRVFQAWLEPFKHLGLNTVSSWNVGNADRASFARVGLPSFGFIQDPIDYKIAIHSSTDVYERIQGRDLQFNAAVVASLAWHAAQRDEKLPRVGEGNGAKQ